MAPMSEGSCTLSPGSFTFHRDHIPIKDIALARSGFWECGAGSVDVQALEHRLQVTGHAVIH